jgi:hypothetical protein
MPKEFYKNTPNLKQTPGTHYWKGTKEEVMNLLAFSLLRKPYQKPDNTSETPIFLDLFCEKIFHVPLKFLPFVSTY